MSKVQRGTIVKAFLKLQNIECAEKVTTAVNSYFSSNYGDYVFGEIRDGGINSNELTVVFIGPGQDHKELAESVHRFLSSFMDEFYDDTLEDDWLNEMDCDDMPIIVSYEVNAAEDYIEEEE
jgi:hypothetical protein